MARRARGPVYTGRASSGGGGYRVVGSEEFHELASRLREADRPLRTAVNKGLREVGKPLGEEMLRSGADAMPRRGGLSARVRNTGVTLGLLRGGTGASGRVEIRLRSKEGFALAAMNRGTVRHPVFGRRPWVSQSVREGAFTEPFDRSANRVRDELANRIAKALDEIAGE